MLTIRCHASNEDTNGQAQQHLNRTVLRLIQCISSSLLANHYIHLTFIVRLNLLTGIKATCLLDPFIFLISLVSTAPRFTQPVSLVVVGGFLALRFHLVLVKKIHDLVTFPGW